MTSRNQRRICVMVAVMLALMTFVPHVSAQDTLINLMQWPAADGGNDHWYGVLPVAQKINQQSMAAAALTHDGLNGYLATITSVEENNFITDHLIAGLPPVPDSQLFLGAEVECGITTWTNREAVSYLNWSPRDDSRVLKDVTMFVGNDTLTRGTWHNCQSHVYWALVEFGTPVETTAPDTIVNLIQWPADSGGNDHWYAVVPKSMPWIYHEAYAKTLLHDTAHGYLVTITSRLENEFVTEHVIRGIVPNATMDEYYLGGKRDSSASKVSWLTGEAAKYKNWAWGEPNGDGIGMAIWGKASGRVEGTWNDVPPDTTDHGCFHQIWSIVEWGAPDTTPIVVDTSTHLVQWPVSQGGNDHWYAIIRQPDTWAIQDSIARQLIHDGVSGYLATITSPEENQFILHQVLGSIPAEAMSETYFLGGHRPCSAHEWVTGETFTYRNWRSYVADTYQSNMFMNSPLESNFFGTWGDVSIFDRTLRPAIVEFGPPVQRTTDTLVNLVQWPAAEGGNDHWYAVIALVEPWVDQFTLAQNLWHGDLRGYLATITSAEESQFIVDHVIKDVLPNAITDEYYLGGRRPLNGSEFAWLTGESMDYTHWASGEPSGDGPVMAIWGQASGRTTGSLNDVPEDTIGIDCYHQIYAVVEWGTTDPSARRIVPGNVDCDPENRVDISDLTFLIDHEYIHPSRWNFLWCPGAANIDGDSRGDVDIADITALIDYLYISFTPPKQYK